MNAQISHDHLLGLILLGLLFVLVFIVELLNLDLRRLVMFLDEVVKARFDLRYINIQFTKPGRILIFILLALILLCFRPVLTILLQHVQRKVVQTIDAVEQVLDVVDLLILGSLANVIHVTSVRRQS